jgi:hypothetical protein
MKIQCLTPFLDGNYRFETDDIRTVDDARGAYFVANGWARDVSGEIATGAASVGEVVLDTQSIVMKQAVRHG